MALVPDDRLNKALVLGETVRYNMTLPGLRQFLKWIVVDRKKEVELVRNSVDKLSIRTPSTETNVNTLSGGNKQKVSFSKWITREKHEPFLFIFDEPTEGVDVGAREDMYRIINKFAEAGGACLVVSSEIEEIVGLCDRAYVMREGRITAEVTMDTTDVQEKLIKATLGEEESHDG
jgi:ABC-type sugar transport system ATPase subunit